MAADLAVHIDPDEFAGAALTLAPSADNALDVPSVAAGHLWLIRLPCDSWALSPAEAQAIAAANVIIYDPDAAPLVASLLPLGGYAESRNASSDGFERACRFVLDGWSVVRLVVEGEPCGGVGRVSEFADRLLARGVRGDLPARLITDCGLGLEMARTRLDAVAALVEGLGPYKPVTIVFDPLGSGTAPHLYAVASNGLAG